ncbi:MAG TPA: hypothetical protein VGU90_17310 [Terriglobales bacterium]|nr:hypothetical protein [Terriglobales bacterium]
MNTRTQTVTLDTPKERAFAFLSQVENLPKWATLFCRELRKTKDGRYKVVTPGGEIFFRIEADPGSGVIDMYGGPSEDQMAYWPARVVGMPGSRSLFIFTAFQYPGVKDEEFAQQCEGLKQEFPHIKAAMEERV